MLHHLPTQALQFTTLGEAFRLLRPGGVLLGADSLASQELHAFHEGDTYNPIDPARLIVFLSSDQLDYVTGDTWYIDGGQKLWGDVWELPEET